MSYKKDIELHRVNKDKYFKESHHSPLTHHLQHEFTGLDYYPIDENLKFEVELTPFDKPEVVQMETSDNNIRDYFNIGYLKFEIEGEEAKIHIYQPLDDPHQYFIPFRDATSAVETYGAGRYIDVEKHGNHFNLDFNLAYSPMCAYSENFSCPFPPLENHLKVSIKAGEKNFPLEI